MTKIVDLNRLTEKELFYYMNRDKYPNMYAKYVWGRLYDIRQERERDEHYASVPYVPVSHTPEGIEAKRMVENWRKDVEKTHKSNNKQTSKKQTTKLVWRVKNGKIV